MILPMKAQEGVLGVIDDFGIANNKQYIEPGTRFFIQEKIDGHRHMIKIKNHEITEAWSSLGKDAMDKMTPVMRRECRKLHDGVYDGELYIYNKDRGNNGQNYTSTDVVRLDLRKKLRYYIFDYIKESQNSVYHNQFFRLRLLDIVFNECFDKGKNKHIKMMPIRGVAQYGTSLISFPYMFFPLYDRDLIEGTVSDVFTDVLHHGGEGLILKDILSNYTAGKRAYTWLKLKNKKEQTFDVRDIIWDSDDDEVKFPYGRFILHNTHYDEVIVRVPTQEWREKLISDPTLYVKLLVTVKYQDETRDGALRHPIVNKIEIV